MRYGALSAVLTLMSTEPPALIDDAVAKPSMLVEDEPTGPAEVARQAVVPGVQFSTTIALPVEHVLASGLAEMADDAPESPELALARTA